MMRIELTPSAWKAEVLPLNYIRTIKNWSGRRDSNSRPSPWQGDALPLSHFRILLVEGGGFEPPKAQLTDLQSAPFGHSGIPRCSLLRHYTIFSANVQMFLLELAEGITHMLRICRPRCCPAAASDISLIESPPDFLFTLEPFRVRFLPVFIGAGGGNRTPNLLITNQLLYR